MSIKNNPARTTINAPEQNHRPVIYNGDPKRRIPKEARNKETFKGRCVRRNRRNGPIPMKGGIIIDPWDLFRRLGDANKFRILQLLAKDPHSPKRLAEKTKLSGSTIRTDLRSLRKCGFVKPEGDRHNRRYSLAESLPSVAHELALAVILRAEVRIQARPKEDRSRLSPERVKRLQNKAFTEITKTILDQFFIYQGYGRRKRKLEDLRETLREIDDQLEQGSS